MPAGRKSVNVEFLNKLYKLSDSQSAKDFANLCGKQVSNMTNYLNGNQHPGDVVLRDCARSVFGWKVNAEREIVKVPDKLSKLPTTGGIYILYGSAANVLYIGQATNLRAEVRQTLGRSIPVGMRLGPSLDNSKSPKFKELTTHLSLYEIENQKLRHNVEALLIRIFVNQTHNTNVEKLK